MSRGHAGILRWPIHGPGKLREQPDGGLFGKLVFGAGVGAHDRTMNQSNEHAALDSPPFVSKGKPLKFKDSRRIACFLRALLLTKLG